MPQNFDLNVTVPDGTKLTDTHTQGLAEKVAKVVQEHFASLHLPAAAQSNLIVTANPVKDGDPVKIKK
jgi:hypothetical protein